MARVVPGAERALVNGYGHPLYAEALDEFGAPLDLPASGGRLLERTIAGCEDRDAMGPYPLFCCPDWRALQSDLDSLQRRLVSVVLVADPFADHDEELLGACFDRVAAFKTHFVVDLEQPGPCGSPHHRYYAARALRDLAVEIPNPPEAMLPDWTRLYSQLIERHAIRGIQAFSEDSFRKQFRVPGLVAMRAIDQRGECVAAHLWFVNGEVAYSHLGAASAAGYKLSASYALHAKAIEHFRGKVRWLDLGGGFGNGDVADGLTRFKAGWSNATRTAFLCGRILDERRYRALCRSTETTYFPAYRYADAS